MEKLNFEQIIEKLKSKISLDNFAYEDYDATSLELGEIEEVEQFGGEGYGDTWFSVKYFKDHDIYIKVNGFYSSYNGTDFYGWEDCKQVVPQQKVITVYE